MKTFAIYNLGCNSNIIDGEKIASYLSLCGFAVTEQYDKAEIIVVNTCTFIREATEETIDAILEIARFKKEGICSTLIVSGCFSERYRNVIKKEFPEVDIWIGIHNWDRELNRYFKVHGSVPFERELSSKSATQYLKISNGCSNACTYCIIPSVRGTYKSRSVNSIIKEALWLRRKGVKECIIVSQDSSFYGRDIGTSLSELLQILVEKVDFHWIRVMYLHPRYVDNNLIKTIAEEKRICSYFDIPLQHIADQILKNMGRKPLSKDLYSLIENIRITVPDAVIRTAFILGFPGENARHFSQLLSFVEWARFEKIGLFPFSPEEGTRAFDMRMRPKTSTTTRRFETLMDFQREISREICEEQVGSKTEVIIDRISEESEYKFEGRTRGDAPEIDGRVFLLNGNFCIGSFAEVTIIGANDYDLYAKECNQKSRGLKTP